MKCIQVHSPLLPLHSEHKVQQRLKQMLCPVSKKSTGTFPVQVPQSQDFRSARSVRTKALPHSIVFAATPPSESGDISGLLQIGALLLFVYFIGNFVVPEFISKSLEFDKVNENQKVDDAEASKDR